MNNEQFTRLVAEMRTAEKDYWIARDHNDLTKALSLERRVDEEIQRVALALRDHPERQPPKDNPQWKFFCLVTCLRDASRKYFAEKKAVRRLPERQQQLSQDGIREHLVSVRHYEAEVDRTLRRISNDQKRARGIIITFQVIRTRPRMREPQVVLSTEDEHYANVECYDLNTKSRDGSIYGIRQVESQRPQPQQAALAFAE